MLPAGITKTPSGKYKIESRRSGKFLNVVIEDLDEAKAKLKKFQEDNPIKKRTTKTTTISGDRLKVLNKYAQDAFGLNYKDLGPGQVQEVYNTARNNKFVYRTETIQSPFDKKNKNKIIEFAKKKNIKLDFDRYPKYGVPKEIKGKRNSNYTSLINFKNRGFKDFKKDLLSEADRIKVMDNNELPKGVKKWKFDENRYGLSYEGNKNLIARIKSKLKEKKKYNIAADWSKPHGWMMHAMNRLYKNEKRNNVKDKNLTYKPKFNDKGIIVGFTDNTAAGGGKTYYGLKKYNEELGDGTAWRGHGDFNRINKFLKIAKGAQVDDPGKLLQKILDDKGITKLLGPERRLTLNDILSHERYFDKLSDIKPSELIKRQIVLHHTKGVDPTLGRAAATKDIQLLSGLINQKVKGLEGFAKERKLTIDEIADLKNYGAKIVNFDGKIVGAGYLDPERQYAEIEKGALKYAQSDKFTVKTVSPYLKALIAEGNAGGPICGLVRKKGAIGGPQTPGCGDEVRQALQDDPDKLIQEAANSKVKPGENTKFRNIARQILSKIPKGGRLGAILAGAGAVGLGTYAMMGDAEADETRTTDQTMTYNSTTGAFDGPDGEPLDQQSILDWVAENPGKAGFAALPAFMGLGYGLSAAGMKRAGQHLMSWKAVIPAMMIPEKMHQWKTGMEAGEMITDPWNAIWALGIDSTKSLARKGQHYVDLLPKGDALRNSFANALRTNNIKAQAAIGKKAFELTGANILGRGFWTSGEKMTRLGQSLVSPAATGTDWSFQKRLKPLVKKLAQAAGSPFAKGAMRHGLGTLAKRAAIGLGAAALLPATVAAGIMSAPLTLGLMGASAIYGQYKDWRDGKAIVDAMRAKGKISEEDAENYMSLIKQGSLPFGLGNRLWGDEEMTIRGQTLNPEQQRDLLAGMEGQIDLFQYGDPSRNIEGRQDVRARDRADDFGFFSEGGRVGMKFGGGIDRRAFLKWLAGLGAGAIGAATGLFKTGSKQVIKEVAKQVPKQFANVPGMPVWFPRVVQKIKTHGKLIEMADKDYVNGDIYEMIIPTKVAKFDMVAGQQKQSGFQTVNKKVLLEENPVSGEIEISWSVDDFDGTMKRQINFKPGESGFQKFGADPEHPGAWEYQRVKIEEPEFTYGNPDQSVPDRADFDYKDIFEEPDEVVKALEDLTGNKKMVAKDGSIIETTDIQGVDEAFQKKIFKDIEGEAGLIPDPEGHMTPEGWQGEKGNPIIEGDLPEWVPKDTWTKKARGGTIETGDIARRQSLVPPLSGPDPQGIMGLYSSPKQVRIG